MWFPALVVIAIAAALYYERRHPRSPATPLTKAEVDEIDRHAW